MTGLMRFMRVTKLLVLLSQDNVITNIFRVTGPLRGEFTGKIPLTKASDAELRCFLSAPEQTVEQNIKTPVIWCVEQ